MAHLRKAGGDTCKQTKFDTGTHRGASSCPAGCRNPRGLRCSLSAGCFGRLAGAGVLVLGCRNGVSLCSTFGREP